jgi:hypothetical protein
MADEYLDENFPFDYSKIESFAREFGINLEKNNESGRD